MKIKDSQTNTWRALKVATFITGFYLANNAAQANEMPVTYSKPPMAAFASQMEDALLGNKYAKPVWNLHDTLKLPDWFSVAVNQRTRYENLEGTFRTNTNGGEQQIALQTDLWIQAQWGAFRIATEFMDSRVVNIGGKLDAAATNLGVDTADFIQGYIVWAEKNVLGSNLGAEVKVGRQLMNLGSRRLVANTYFRNTTNSFTGGRFRLLDGAKWEFNGFVTMPVNRLPSAAAAIISDKHAFDQEATNTLFAGGILEVRNLFKGINGEAYLYSLNEENSWNYNSRRRHYYTPGIRFYLKPAKGRFDFQAESMGQFGTVHYSTVSTQEQQHRAWAEHVDVGYTFNIPWSPRIVLEYDYASGSKNPGANASSDQRFDQLYGSSVPDMGQSGIYNAFQRSNINSPGYKLNLAPRPDTQFTLQQRLVWLASASDCWGGPSCSLASSLNLQPTKSSGSYVGNQLGVTGRYDFNSSLNIEAGWFHLFKGQFARQAAATINGGGAGQGSDVDYFYVQSQLRF